MSEDVLAALVDQLEMTFLPMSPKIITWHCEKTRATRGKPRSRKEKHRVVLCVNRRSLNFFYIGMKIRCKVAAAGRGLNTYN